VVDIWRNNRLVSSMAAFSWSHGELDTSTEPVQILFARVSPNFFDLLGVRPQMGRMFRESDLRDCADCVVLGHELWKIQFRADPGLVGRKVMINGHAVMVLGILPEHFSFGAPGIAGWGLLDPAAPSFHNYVDRMGAVARLRAGVSEAQAARGLEAATENAGYHFVNTRIQVESVKAQARQATEWYVFLLLLAGVASACIAWFGFARARFGGRSWNAPNPWRWWGFFIAKTALALAISFVAALELTRYLSVLLTGTVLPMANVISVWVFLLLAIGLLSWAIHDQRRRCRVCLQRLGLPVHVGYRGYLLLDPAAATELLCAEGHGMLHLADTEASWADSDEWNALDSSWAGLFEP
jgi:hypothetical protein